MVSRFGDCTGLTINLEKTEIFLLGNRWCSHSRSKTRNTEVCRKKDTAKTVSDDSKDASFAFKVTVDNLIPLEITLC